MHWTFDLHADGSDGPLLCRAQSSYNGPPLLDEVNHGPTILSMTGIRYPVKMERKRGAFNGTVFFEGPDHKEYRWQTTARLFSAAMEVRTGAGQTSQHLSRSSRQCLDAEDALIATYRVTSMSVTKDGVLVVQPVRSHSAIPGLCSHLYDSRGNSCWTCSSLPALRCARPITEMSFRYALFYLYLEELF